ncbi:MAG: hypothetical protein NZ703_02140 [Gemmataceae bacterium]|nr:hypothetical protein [Gemmataceae bacterium]
MSILEGVLREWWGPSEADGEQPSLRSVHNTPPRALSATIRSCDPRAWTAQAFVTAPLRLVTLPSFFG